jgi:hypothetical protein
MSKTTNSFGVSERVTHFMYGPGTITEIGNVYTTIDFDENGRRKFVTTMVQLEPTTILAPIPVKKSRAKPKTPKEPKEPKEPKAPKAAKAGK